MKPSTDPRVLAYVRLVRCAESLHAEVSRGLAIDGLSASQFSTMKALRIHGKLSQREIAKYILKTSGNITVLVDNLEAMGLVERFRDTEDRRITYVSLTEKGNTTFDDLYPGHVARIVQVMDAASLDECELLSKTLEKLSEDSAFPACQPAQTKVGSIS